eukprot:2441799-Karenia_brevis.AAC.1
MCIRDSALTASNLRVVCMDMNHIGSDDVVGCGPLMIALARQNGNDFVPLLDDINVAGSVDGQQPNADGHFGNSDSAVMDDDSAIFGDSQDSSDSMSSCSHEDSTDADKDLIQDVLVEEPPPEAVL